MMMIMSMLINFLFLNFNNPLIMGILLIMQTMTLIMMMGKIYYSFWFSYIMFLVFIGGLFILFIYIISLTFNNKFFLKLLKMNHLLLLIILFMNIYNYYYLNYETNIFKKKNFFLMENTLNLMKFYNFPNNMINLMMIMYLLLLLIIVVKIINFKKGPIRSL